MLGRTSLIERRGGRFVVRERQDIERLLGKAYAAGPPLDQLMHRLGNVAIALNANDQFLARLAAVHLEIPDLPNEAAPGRMEAEDILIKSVDWNPALHPRTGTAPNAGWFATTEGPAGSSPIRTSQNNRTRSDAASAISKPGDHFPTQDAAAIAALLAAEAARSTNLEYAGRIYQNPDGTFSYTRALTLSQLDPALPNKNCCPNTSSPGPAPLGTIAVASYHTHPVISGFNEAEFSGDDVVFYTYTDKLPGYLAGTDAQGVLQFVKFTPGQTMSQGITQILGRISSGKFVPNPAYDPNKTPYTPPPGGDSYDPDRDDPK